MHINRDAQGDVCVYLTAAASLCPILAVLASNTFSIHHYFQTILISLLISHCIILLYMDMFIEVLGHW